MSNHLQFPRGIGTDVKFGQPYMLLTSYESKNAIESVGVSKDAPRGKTISSIALYIPPNSLKQTSLDFFYLIEQKDHNCEYH